jgi:hypothetical protein
MKGQFGPAMASKDFVIFYSWQTDLPDSTNRTAIRLALKSVAFKLEESRPELKILIDEATRGEPGSPDIPTTILAKIDKSDVFVGDLTTVNKQAGCLPRATANANVLIELGYAVAQLGWQRIVLTFNTGFGNFPTDLPFDIDKRRGLPYEITPEASKTKGVRSSLEAKLKDAVVTIIAAQPRRPIEADSSDPEVIRRSRDLRNLRWALGTIHWPSVDKHIQELPRVIIHQVFYFWEDFNAAVNSSLFHLYDSELASEIETFHHLWGLTLSYGRHYRMVPSGYYVFDNPGDLAFTEEQERDWEQIEAHARALADAKRSLLQRLRRDYVEIDIDDLSSRAWTRMREYLSRLGDLPDSN